MWSYTSIPPYIFMMWCLVKHRNNFTFRLPSTVGVCLMPPVRLAAVTVKAVFVFIINDDC
jgi:hypothetical protein